MDPSNIDMVVAVPTFIGSLLSFLATSSAIVLHVVAPPKQHFRHALIMNLLVADCMNSLNNTISGAVALASRGNGNPKTVDSACIANAWIGQFSVQTVDFTMLIISIVVLFTVLESRTIPETSTKARIALCVAGWIPGFITSNIGLGLGIYGHVSGNWCWIRPEFLGLRYALTHAWRIAIFVATVAIYTFVYARLKRTFNRFRITAPGTDNTTSVNATIHDNTGSDTQHILAPIPPTEHHELEERPTGWSINHQAKAHPTPHGKAASTSVDDVSQNSRTAVFATQRARPELRQQTPKLPAPPNLRKMMLLNGYPIAYVILWLPGIINRLVESVGSSPRWLQALQCSTQYVGFFNAITYGFSEHSRQAVRKWMTKRRKFHRAVG